MAKRMDNGNGRPTHEEIEQRAKALYEASGKVQGRDLDNWLAAEAELISARRSVGETRAVYKDSARH